MRDLFQTNESPFPSWVGMFLEISQAHDVRIITLTQPWASLVAYKLKRFETRGWSTDFRGPLLIHASKRWDANVESYCRAWEHELAAVGVNALELPLGQVVALTSLEDMHRTLRKGPEVSEEEIRAGDWAPGRFAWQLGEVERLRMPIPWKGQQGLRKAPLEIVEAVGRALVDNRARPR